MIGICEVSVTSIAHLIILFVTYLRVSIQNTNLISLTVRLTPVRTV